MTTPPDSPQTPAPDQETLRFTPKLVVACLLGVIAVAVISGAALAGVQDVTSTKGEATPSVQQMTQLLERVTYKTPEPTPDPASLPQGPIVGAFPTPGDSSSSSAATPSATGTVSVPRGAAPTVAPAIDLGPQTQSTPSAQSSPSAGGGPSLIVTPIPAITAPTPAISAPVLVTPASSAPSVATVRPAATP